jgi:hypothetical protein
MGIALPMVQRLLNCQEHVALGVEPAKIVFGGYETMDRYLQPETNVPNTGAKSQLDGIDKIASKERKLVVKDYIADLVDAQRAVITTTKDYQDSYLRARRSKVDNQTTVTSADYKIGDWVLCGWQHWQGLALGKTRLKKLQPCWRGPFQVVKTDAKRQTVTLLDPTDLKVVSPDVHMTVLTNLKYRKGLTSSDDLPVIEHDMYYELTQGIKLNKARS